MVKSKPKSVEIQWVVDSLTEDEIKQMQKDNPFRNDRNAKIRELINRGVKRSILAHISGLSENVIGIIKMRKYKILD